MHPEMVPTTITRVMLESMTRTHQRRRISVYSGPPGIGKTTAIHAFAAANPMNVAVVEAFTRKTTERFVFQAMVRAIRRISESRYTGIEGDLRMSMAQLDQEIMIWAGYKSGEKIKDQDNAPVLTFVFDEAQNMPPNTLDTLRHLNDWNPYKDQLKIGIIFVGNHEFTLDVDVRGRRTMLDAFKDRVYDDRPFKYEDVSAGDIALFAGSRGITDPEAQALIARAFNVQRGSRSFRRIADLIDDILDEAGDQPANADTVRSILTPA